MKQKSTRHLVRFITRALVINIIGGWISESTTSRVCGQLVQKKKTTSARIEYEFRLHEYHDFAVIVVHLSDPTPIESENVEIARLSKAKGISIFIFDCRAVVKQCLVFEIKYKYMMI